MIILISTERQFNWVSDVFYFMKKSALAFELYYFKDTYQKMKMKTAAMYQKKTCEADSEESEKHYLVQQP